MNNNNIGSGFDDFLKEETLLDEATAVAVKRVIAWQISEEVKVQKLIPSHQWPEKCITAGQHLTVCLMPPIQALP
jgi:hypothetical protein